MSRIVVANPRAGREFETDFATFVSLIKGTAIVSAADSDQFVEFGLSESLLVRIEPSGGGPLQITIVSTLNPDETAPVRLQLVRGDELPSAATIEQRLHDLRQIYAIAYLLNAGRQDELGRAVNDNPEFDLEQLLLKEDERLCIQAAGPGSFWITVLTKVAGAGQTTLNMLSLLYGEGREMLIERVRIGTAIKREELLAKQEELRGKQIENDRAAAAAAFELFNKLEKIKNPENREAVRALLLKSSAGVNEKTLVLLPAPGKR